MNPQCDIGLIGLAVMGQNLILNMADHGFQVDLIEKEDNLGGNLLWLRHTLDGNTTQEFLDEMVQKTERHPKIEIHTRRPPGLF